jgi:hypothetical protein
MPKLSILISDGFAIAAGWLLLVLLIYYPIVQLSAILLASFCFGFGRLIRNWKGVELGGSVKSGRNESGRIVLNPGSVVELRRVLVPA